MRTRHENRTGHSPSWCVPRGNRWTDWRLIGLRGHREEDSPHIHPNPWTALRSGSPLFSSRIGAILAPFMWALIPFSSTQAPLGISFLAQTFTMGFFFFFPTLFFQTLKGFDSSRFISKHLKERRPAGRQNRFNNTNLPHKAAVRNNNTKGPKALCKYKVLYKCLIIITRRSAVQSLVHLWRCQWG